MWYPYVWGKGKGFSKWVETQKIWEPCPWRPVVCCLSWFGMVSELFEGHLYIIHYVPKYGLISIENIVLDYCKGELSLNHNLNQVAV